MQIKEKPVTTVNIWNHTWQHLATLKKPFLQISFFAVFLPGVIVSFLLAGWSEPLAEQIKSLAHTGIYEGQALHYQQFFAIISGFLGVYLVCGLVLVVLVVAAFYALVKIAVASYYEELLPAKTAFKDGLRFVFPRGFLLFLLLFVFSLEQVLFGPFHVFTLFALMAPVIIIAENRGTFAAFKSAILFRYTSPARGGGFATSFVLLTLSAMIYGAQSLLQVGVDFLLHADQWFGLPRSLWALKLPGLPFSPVYALANILSVGVNVLLLAFIVCFMVSLFFNVRPQVSHRI